MRIVLSWHVYVNKVYRVFILLTVDFVGNVKVIFISKGSFEDLDGVICKSSYYNYAVL